MIPYGRQQIDQHDIEAVVEVLKSDYLTQGPVIPRFEDAVAKYCGVKSAVAVNSATSALHIACMALGVAKGDVVWTSPNTFVASSNVALLCGAEVDFIDIDPKTYNISIEALEIKLARADKIGKLPKVIIPVHFAGQSCDMKAIAALAQKYGFRVLEDASHCIGGGYAGQKIGSCIYSDACVFSFHPVKIITTAEGGMVTTNDDELFKKMTMLRTHGITRDQTLFAYDSNGAWYYEQQLLGPNYRITDMQAALGLSQMARLDNFIARRRILAKRYNELFENTDLAIPYQAPDTDSAWHLYVVGLPQNKNRKNIYNNLREDGIGVNVHYIPVHLQPYYQALGFKQGEFPNAEKYYRGALTIPLYAGLTDEEQRYVSERVIERLQS